jgi:hypothetical protein
MMTRHACLLTCSAARRLGILFVASWFSGVEDPVWSKNPIYLKSNDDGGKGPRAARPWPGPWRNTPLHLRETTRNAAVAPSKPACHLFLVLNEIEFFDHTGSIRNWEGCRAGLS